MSFTSGEHVQQIRDDVGRAGQQAALKQHNVGGIALDGRAEILQGIRLCDDAQVVLQRENLANTDTVNRLGIGKNYPDGARLDRSARLRHRESRSRISVIGDLARPTPAVTALRIGNRR